LQYSTEGLKGVLQWIIENLNLFKNDLNSLHGLKARVEQNEK